MEGMEVKGKKNRGNEKLAYQEYTLQRNEERGTD